MLDGPVAKKYRKPESFSDQCPQIKKFVELKIIKMIASFICSIN